MSATYSDRIDGIETSSAVKAPVVVATTGNITLSGLQTIDGIAVTSGMRVLVKDQSNAVENGIWEASTGTWSRATDFNGARDVVEGSMIYVSRGDVNRRIPFVLTTVDPVVGSSAMTFVVGPPGVSDGAYASRSAVIAATVPAPVVLIRVKTPQGDTISYKPDATGTALTTAGGRNWSPDVDVYPDHWAENTTPGTTDMTTAYQAALDYGAGGTVKALPQIYAISAQLRPKSQTYWDHNGSTLKAIGAGGGTFFSLWRPENGGREMRVVGQRIDCNNVAGMAGFILRVGQNSIVVDGFIVENFLHQKGGIDGGRGFVVESEATVLDNANVIVTNGICRTGYMGFAFQSGDDRGDRHNVIIDNITVEDCDIAIWMPGNTVNYPHTPTEMQAIISNITAHNCGVATEYTNGGGAFGADRACNVKMSNIVLSNDVAYGSIPSVWHGNGANIDADITFYGDCTDFWNFQPYKEADAPPASEFTIQDSILRAVHHGSCTDVATIGTSSGAAAVNVHISGQHDTITSGLAAKLNLRQPDVWFDIFHKTDNSRIQGSGSDIGTAAFANHPNVVRRYSQKDKQTPFVRFLTIADGAAGSIAVPDNMFAFQAIISGNSDLLPRANFACRSEGTEFVRSFGEGAGSGGVTFFNATGVLTGATGLSGRVAVSVESGRLYIENQSGALGSFAITINPSV